MVEETDKTIAQVSKELGIGSNLIGRWKRELADTGFKPGPVGDDKDAEIRRLQAELRDLKEDHGILKKAVVNSMDQRNTPHLLRILEESLPCQELADLVY